MELRWRSGVSLCGAQWLDGLVGVLRPGGFFEYCDHSGHLPVAPDAAELYGCLLVAAAVAAITIAPSRQRVTLRSTRRAIENFDSIGLEETRVRASMPVVLMWATVNWSRHGLCHHLATF